MTTIDGLIYYADLDEFWTGFMNRALRGSGLIGDRSTLLRKARWNLAQNTSSRALHEKVACELISSSAAFMAHDDSVRAFEEMTGALDVLELLESRVGFTTRTLVIDAALRYNMVVHCLRADKPEVASTLAFEMLESLRASADAAPESDPSLFKSVFEHVKTLIENDYPNDPVFAGAVREISRLRVPAL